MSKAIVFGRFNNPHIGHVGLIAEALRYANEVIVVLGKSKKNVSYDLRLKILKKLLQFNLSGPDMASIRFVQGSATTCKEYNADYILFGKDRLKGHGASFLASLAENAIFINRPENSISSTLVREQLQYDLDNCEELEFTKCSTIFDEDMFLLQIEAMQQYYERGNK